MKELNPNLLEMERIFLDLTSAAFSKDESWFGPEHGEGLFGGALTVWLMMLQGLKGASMSQVVSELQAGAADLILASNTRSKRVRERRISGNTGGYARARQRLPEVDVEDIVAVVNDGLRRQLSVPGAFKSSVYFIDGTELTLARTIEIEREYPRHKGVHGWYNHPTLRVVFAAAADSGVAVHPCFGPTSGVHASCEQKLSRGVLDSIESGALVVGDRNFGVFSVISHAATSGKQVLMRLAEHHAKKFIRKSRGELDLRDVWSKSKRDQLLDEQDVTEVSGRFIRTKLKESGFRPLTLYFFTTSELPVAELVRLYGRRNDIEVDIRQLKTLFSLEQLMCRRPEMVRKELLVRFASYNLMRVVLAQAAEQIGLPARRLSFKNAANYTMIFGSKIARATDVNERQKLFKEYLLLLYQTKLPNRKRKRHEPRMLTRRRSAYLIMKGSRADAKKKS